MGHLIVDYECNADKWWSAARVLANSVRSPTFTRLLNELERSDAVECADGDVDVFVQDAERLPGWDCGPKYAPSPVRFDYGSSYRS